MFTANTLMVSGRRWILDAALGFFALAVVVGSLLQPEITWALAAA